MHQLAPSRLPNYSPTSDSRSFLTASYCSPNHDITNVDRGYNTCWPIGSYHVRPFFFLLLFVCNCTIDYRHQDNATITPLCNSKSVILSSNPLDHDSLVRQRYGIFFIWDLRRYWKMCLCFDSLDRYSLVHKDNAAVILISDWISLFDLVRNMLSLILIMLSKLANFMALTPQFCTIKLTFWRVSNYFYCTKKYMDPFVWNSLV